MWCPCNRVRALIRRDPRELFLSLSCEDIVRRKPFCKIEREPDHAGTPDLELPASKTVINLSLLFKPPILWYFVMAARADQDICNLILYVMISRSSFFLTATY